MSDRLGKTQRQYRISQILEAHAVTSQGHLVELLEAEGIGATQATVSRDLEDIGAVKVRVPGGDLVYAIPEQSFERAAPDDHLRRVFSDWVVDVGHSLNVVLVRTPPGSAHVVGSAIDRAALAGVLGSVAGDDTVMIIATEDAGGQKVAAHLRELAGL